MDRSSAEVPSHPIRWQCATSTRDQVLCPREVVRGTWRSYPATSGQTYSSEGARRETTTNDAVTAPRSLTDPDTVSLWQRHILSAPPDQSGGLDGHASLRAERHRRPRCVGIFWLAACRARARFNGRHPPWSTDHVHLRRHWTRPTPNAGAWTSESISFSPARRVMRAAAVMPSERQLVLV